MRRHHSKHHHQLSATSVSLTIPGNSNLLAIGIPRPKDAFYDSKKLTVKVTGLPSDGAVLLSNGVTVIHQGEKLTVAQLMGLEFRPAEGAFGETSMFRYKVSDPSGAKAKGTATLTIAPDTTPPTTTAASLTVAENAAATPIGIAAPTDPNYAASQLRITVTGLPSDGTVLLSDGTAVTVGESLTVAQLTGLEFRATADIFGQNSTFSYQIVDPAGLSANGTASFTVGPDTTPPTTTAASLTVAENAAATPIGIAAPTDPNYAASQLRITVTSLPSDGTVLLSDGVTQVKAGDMLTVAALTSLLFTPAPNVSGVSSNFLYTVSDPSGLDATGSVVLKVATTGGISPDGSTLLPGSGGSLVTSAGTWTFGTTTDPWGNTTILLNGSASNGGHATELLVANGGKMYAENSSGWYQWVNGSWAGAPITTTPVSLTVAENAGETAIGITAPTDPIYPAQQVSVTVSALPNDGAVLLSGAPVSVGESLSAAQLTELEFQPGKNRSGMSGFFGYTVTGASGMSGWGYATLIIKPGPLTTTPGYLSLPGNAGAKPIGIAGPSDANYSASQLSITVTGLPNDGTVLLSDGATPVTVGESLTAAQLTGLEFQPATNVFNQASSLTYSVSDPAGVAASGCAILSVGGSPAALWQDPPSGATAASGVDIAPTVVQPSQPGDIVGVQLQNTGSATEAGGYVTFGEVFLDGAVNPGDSLVARIGGVNYFVQMDVKSTNPDGSVRQAVLTLDAPAIPAGGTLDLMLAKGMAAASSPAAPSAAALLSSGYDVSVNFTFNNPDGTTTTDSASASAALQAALNGGTVQNWLAGPGVNEYDVQTTVDGGKLKVEFDIRAYANGATTTDVVFDNSWMFSSGKTDLNYNVSINQGGQQVYSASNVQQYLYSMWDHQVASAGVISPNVQYDVPYLMATGATQAYDTSFGASDFAIQKNFSALNATNTGPMGTAGVGTYMPGTGGRQDIGPQPNWTAQWLLSQNAAAQQVMMADANASGGIPWHYTDENTGKPINAQTYPNFTINENFPQYGFLQPANGWPNYSNTGNPSADGDPWMPDPAHMPDLNYLPYFITGSHYQLQLLQAQADFAITDVLGHNNSLDTSGNVPLGFADSFSGNGNLFSSNGNQLRAVSWELRNVAEAAYITPDNDPLKSYFTNELDVAMRGLVQEYVKDDINGIYGQLNGFLQGSSGPNTGAVTPYEEDEMVTALGTVAGLNIPHASAKAVKMMSFMNNFVSGVFTNGPNGFNPLDGTAYWISVNSGSGSPYTTWSQLFNADINPTWQQGNGGVPENPTELINYATQTMGGYGPVAKAALADEITYTQSPRAIQAYGFVVSQIAYAFALSGSDYSGGSGSTLSAAYQNYPQWSIVPRLPDGSYLENSQMQIDVSDSATVNLTAAGGDALLAVIGSGTATLTSDSGPDGSDLLYGGSGPTTLVAGAGNDYMFGGGSGSNYIYDSGGSLKYGTQQATTFVDGTGDDYMFGGSGPNNYVFRENNSAGPRSTTIANFNISTDELTIAANIDGSGITSASQLIAGATVSNGNTVFHLSPNDDVTLLGVSQPSSLLNSIIVS